MSYSPSMIKFHKAECENGLRFESPIHFIHGNNERTFILFTPITDQEREKYILQNIIESVESCIDILTSNDSFLVKKGYRIFAVIKESELLEVKDAIVEEQMTS